MENNTDPMHSLAVQEKIALVKGVAIFGMVLQGVIFLLPPSRITIFLHQCTMYSLPLFLTAIASEFSLQGFSKKTVLHFFREQLHTFFFPYIILSFLASYFFGNFQNPIQFFSSAISQLILGNALPPFNFFVILFPYIFLFPLFWYLLYVRKFPLVLFLFAGLIINLISYILMPTIFLLNPIFTNYIFFFLLGFVARPLLQKTHPVVTRKIFFPLWCGFLLGVSFLLSQLIPFSYDSSVRFVYGSSVFILIILAHPWLKYFQNIFKFLLLAGEYSLAILFIHYFIILLLPAWFQNTPFFAVILNLFLTMSLSFIFAVLLSPSSRVKNSSIKHKNLFSMMIFLLSICFLSLVYTPVHAQNPVLSSPEQDDPRSLILDKPIGAISVPTLEDETLRSAEHEALKIQLNSIFHLKKWEFQDKKKKHDLFELLIGDLQFTKEMTLIFFGQSLPQSKIFINLKDEKQQQTFPAVADALGQWFVRIPLANTILGNQEITGHSAVGTTVSDTLFLGNLHIVNYLARQDVFEATVEQIRDDETLKRANEEITAPTLATLALINTGATVPLLGFLPYLTYLFSEPLGIIFRKRSKGWGVVYNSLTKQPVDLAIVRLFEKSSGRLLQTKVTDRFGRYNFVVNPGTYSILVQKNEFTFPSLLLNSKPQDAKYTNLYYGGDIPVGSAGKSIITYNLPVDIAKEHRTNGRVIASYLLHQVQRSVALVGPLFATISFVVHPTPFFFFMVVLHVLLYLLFRRFTYTPALKTFGYIFDRSDGKPLTNVIVKLFNAEYNKLLDTKVTNNQGQYNFLVGENVYYLMAEKNGYHLFQSEIIDIKGEEDGIISKDFMMEKNYSTQIQT